MKEYRMFGRYGTLINTSIPFCFLVSTYFFLDHSIAIFVITVLSPVFAASFLLGFYRLSYKIRIVGDKLIESQLFRKNREIYLTDIKEINLSKFLIFGSIYSLNLGPSFKNDKYKNFPRYPLNFHIFEEIRQENPSVKIDPNYITAFNNRNRYKTPVYISLVVIAFFVLIIALYGFGIIKPNSFLGNFLEKVI